MLLYVIVALLYKKDKLKIHFIVFLLFCVSCIECTMNMEETGYSTTGRSAYFKDYDSVKTLTTELSESDDTFYRIAKAFGYRSKTMPHGTISTVQVPSRPPLMPAWQSCSEDSGLNIPWMPTQTMVLPLLYTQCSTSNIFWATRSLQIPQRWSLSAQLTMSTYIMQSTLFLSATW